MRSMFGMSVVLVLAALSVAGCGSADELEDDTIMSSSSGVENLDGSSDLTQQYPLPDGAEIPAFEGAYAAQFEDAYKMSTSDLQREALADGELSELEMRRMYADMDSCLASIGMTGVEVNLDGSLTLRSPDGWTGDQTDAGLRQCEEAHVNLTGMLFNDVNRNPQALDEFEIMAECFVRLGLVEKPYTADDYGRDVSAGLSAWDELDPRIRKCDNDPLGAQPEG